MDFEDIQHVWTGQPDSARGTTDAHIRQALNQTRVLRRRVAARDTIELVTAVGVSAAFLWVATLAPVVWPWVIAALITLGVGVVFGLERLRQPPALSARTDVRHGLLQARAAVDHQVRMLGSVAWWYLAPLSLVALLICAGALLGVKADVGPDVWARTRYGFMGIFALVVPIVGGVFWFVWRLNARMIAAHLLPQRDHLDSLIATLDEPVVGDDQRREEM